MPTRSPDAARVSTFAVLIVVLAVLVAMPRARAQDPGPDAALAAQLAAIDAKARAIVDLSATFIQRKHTAFMKRPLVSTGTLVAKGQRTRWDTTSPRASVLTTSGDGLRVYYPDEGLIEVYPLDARVGELVASPLPRLDLLRRRFEITRIDWDGPPADGERLSLRLVPREASLREHVVEVRVRIDPATGCMDASTVLYPDDERVEMVFGSVRLNTGVRDEQLRLDAPDGVTVTYPLGRPDAAGP